EQTILSRTGGAPTLAVGMAHILSQVFGGPGMMAFWYHFAILFEALFILTTIDAGTRVCRFMIQDLLGTFFKPLGNTDSLPANLLATTLAVSGWGYFLYQGVIDPLGGINTLWPLFGIANQMLAGMALILCTTVLIKMKKLRFAWITALPCVWVLTTTLYAGWLKIFSDNPKIGFLAHAEKFNQAAASGTVLAPAKTLEQMQQVIFNDYVNSALSALFISVVLAMLFFGVRASLQAMRLPHPSAKETPAQFQHDAS
ncbi:MAG: carbon starvation CstA family protein, partial [Plesiomonas shigelloides]